MIQGKRGSAGNGSFRLLIASSLSALVFGGSVATAQSHSGFGPGTDLESGDSVTEDIHQDDLNAGSALRFPGKPLAPWFEQKRKWNENYGLKLNFSYQSLYQKSDNETGEDEAHAGRLELNGSWALVRRGTNNAGRLTFRIEGRKTLGTDIPPSKLGNEFGSGSIVGTGFSEYDKVNLSELAWRQSLMDGRLHFVFGKISAVSWYGGHALASPKRAFQNTALMASNTRAFPGRGFGGGFAYRISPKFTFLAGLHDANAKTTGNPLDTIGQGEFLKSAELRWNLTTPDRARWDQLRLNLWHQDARKQAGVPSSYGANFVASKLMYGDRVMPFLIAGVSDGNASTFKKDVAVGVGIGFNSTQDKGERRARHRPRMGGSFGEHPAGTDDRRGVLSLSNSGQHCGHPIDSGYQEPDCQPEENDSDRSWISHTVDVLTNRSSSRPEQLCPQSQSLF